LQSLLEEKPHLAVIYSVGFMGPSRPGLHFGHEMAGHKAGLDVRGKIGLQAEPPPTRLATIAKILDPPLAQE
jgi:hypothetical protein